MESTDVDLVSVKLWRHHLKFYEILLELICFKRIPCLRFLHFLQPKLTYFYSQLWTYFGIPYRSRTNKKRENFIHWIGNAFIWKWNISPFAQLSWKRYPMLMNNVYSKFSGFSDIFCKISFTVLKKVITCLALNGVVKIILDLMSQCLDGSFVCVHESIISPVLVPLRWHSGARIRFYRFKKN